VLTKDIPLVTLVMSKRFRLGVGQETSYAPITVYTTFITFTFLLIICKYVRLKVASSLQFVLFYPLHFHREPTFILNKQAYKRTDIEMRINRIYLLSTLFIMTICLKFLKVPVVGPEARPH
jgi:hypothetical protein